MLIVSSTIHPSRWSSRRVGTPSRIDIDNTDQGAPSPVQRREEGGGSAGIGIKGQHAGSDDQG